MAALSESLGQSSSVSNSAIAFRWGSMLRFSMSLGLVLVLFSASSNAAPADNAADQQARDTFFNDGEILTLRIRLKESAAEALRQDARTYVSATLIENGQIAHRDVAIKLKGSYGSFQELDDRPAFTINMDRNVPDQRLHGMDKFHLNNSVQDETYLHELLGGEIFRAAGIPAARVTHARVWLDDRDLGIYVLKESLDKDFLKNNFDQEDGNLYDGGLLQEIDAGLQRDEGDRGPEGADLLELAAACRLENLEERWTLIEQHLDVEWFIKFMALELMTEHWDGYCHAQNNYRIYFDPSVDHRARFLPHGMDQLFGDSGASILEAPSGLVAFAVAQNPEWRTLYRQKVNELLSLFEPEERLFAIIDRTMERLQPALEELDPSAAEYHRERVAELKERLIARFASLTEQANQPEPAPLVFDEQGRANLAGWSSRPDTGEPSFEAIHEKGRLWQLGIRSQEGPTVGSWRTTVILPPGQYRFEGRARADGVIESIDDVGIGAGLRISGVMRTNHVGSNGEWVWLKFDFQVPEPRSIELVAELRATQGEVRFDAKSLTLTRIE